MVTRPFDEPRADSGVFVSGIVVNDQVHIEVGRNLRVDVAQKAQELLVPMAWLALSDNAAIGHIERRKQSGGAVPIVVVGYAFDIAEPHRHHRLAAFEGLKLALVVDAQNQCIFRWIQIQPPHPALSPRRMDRSSAWRTWCGEAATRTGRCNDVPHFWKYLSPP